MDDLEALFAESEKGLPEPDRLVSQAHRANLSGNLHLAAELFSQAIAKGKDQAPVHRDLAQVYLALGQPEQAASHLKTALALTPDMLEARGIHRALSEAYEAQGDLDRAQAHYRAFQAGVAGRSSEA